MENFVTYKGALLKYGKKSQKIMFMEEAAELTKELSKDIRGKAHLVNIREEIADVQIMLDQMKIIYGVEECDEAYEKKIQRLKNNLLCVVQ